MKKRRELKSDQLENFVHSVIIMIYKVFFLDISRFDSSIAFQRYQEHPNQSSDEKVMTLRSWSKIRGLQQRRNVENQRHDVVESCRNAASRRRDVATRRRDVRGLFWVDF